MNDAQHEKYRVCAAQAVRAMKRLGYTGTAAELRRFCRVKALGKDKDSHSLNNIEFDSVLAIFAAYHSMADLEEQLRLLEQPLKRILFAACKLLDTLKIEEHGREAYLAAIYRRVQAKRPSRGELVHELADIPDEDFPLVLAALTHTAQHKARSHHAHPRAGKGRSRWDHRVGSKPCSTPTGDAGHRAAAPSTQSELPF